MDEVLQVEDRFYILVSESLSAELSRVLKHADTFALFDPRGDIGADRFPEHGLYHEGTRFLSRFRLRMEDRAPLLLSSRIREQNEAFSADLANADIMADGAVRVPRALLHLYRARFLHDRSLFDSMRVRNHGRSPVSVRLTVEFGADFRDIFEVRGTARERRGQLLDAAVSPHQAVLAYRGLDGVTRRTHVRFDPPPESLDAERARFVLHLEPQDEVLLTVAVDCEGEAGPANARGAAEASHLLHQQLAQHTARQARIATDHEQVNAWLDRSAADLRMMITDTPEGPYPYAGVPWFNTVFGRDGIITALSTLTIDPAIARGVLGHLATTQAAASSPAQDAEPGKILHETRRGEMASLGEVPFGRYYGSVDATPLFVVLAGAYAERTGDRAFLDRIWPNVLHALDWVDRFGDQDGDGFVEYARHTSQGLVQQGWKDSHDSVFHADGTVAEPPIALCEVQGYVYDARRRVAALARVRGDLGLADRLEAQAERLRARFEDVFWCEDLGTYALALDGRKRPCRVVASNAAHCLFSGIASPDRAARVASTLLQPESFSGWGIRTLGAAELRYNPMSYHNGSIWPHDNALAAAGFARYGLLEGVAAVVSAMFDASRHFTLNRMPELFCGFHRRSTEGPTLYPVACAPQAWAAAAAFLLVDALLQLRIDSSGAVHVGARALPPFLDRVVISNLEMAGARGDLRVDRTAEGLAISRPGATR